MRKLLAFLAFATLPSLAFAGEIRIPADQPDLEAALLVAVAGDVILVQTPADQNVNASAGSSGPIRITQPVTIIGDPVCTLNFGYSATGLLLDGPGAGEVILMNVTMNTIIGATSWSPKIHGGGFDSLSLYGFQGLNYFEATTGDGAHSVDLPTIANITMVDSALNTTPVGTDSDSQCIGFFPYHWVPGYGINAPQASILLIDSSVTGGWGAKGGGFDYFEGPCPPRPLDLWRPSWPRNRR